jgi:kinesin family protein 5
VFQKVVELEISLDETREQYNNVLRTSNNRAQQKKMMFLERNLEQRIQSLESLLQDSQEKLTAANHRYAQQLARGYEIYTHTATGSKLNSQLSKNVSKPRRQVPHAVLAHLLGPVLHLRLAAA